MRINMNNVMAFVLAVGTVMLLSFLFVFHVVVVEFLSCSFRLNP